jgi:chorismate mutase/prephenate dehydratase
MSLDDHRREVDRIDRSILGLLADRLRVARAIGEAKALAGSPIYAPQREEEVLSRLVAAAGELPSEGVRAVFREVISMSIGAQMPAPVAYLGPEGSFTHQAALRVFGSSVPARPQRGIADIFAAVEQGEASYGVVPVENSTEGVVSHSLDLLAESPLKVVAQLTLEVEHCLVGIGSLDGIRRVLSKDIALAQCRAWLVRHLPEAELVETTSTAAAVEAVASDSTSAAVASAAAASSRGVPILARGIQDRRDNATRFFVIGPKPNPPGAREEVTSVVLALRHEPGALQAALSAFSSRGINLLRIESRPSRRQAWEYLFFIDFPGHWDSPSVQAALAELSPRCERVTWLGSYPQNCA